MSKQNSNRLIIRLNLLKPQSNPEKLLVRLIRWLIFSGRYIFVVVEAIVLIAFAARFKLDADIAAKKEAIEEQIPYIESLKPYEILIRQTQLKLATISTIRTNSLDFAAVFKKIADQTPVSMKIDAINIERNQNTATVHLTGQTQINNDLTNFITRLRKDNSFDSVDLVSIALEQDVVKFTIDAITKTAGLTESDL